MPAEPVPSHGPSGDVPPNWTSSTEHTAAALVVRLTGELDYPGTAALERLLAGELDTDPPVLVFDMSGVGCCDSSSPQALLRISIRARGAVATLASTATRPGHRPGTWHAYLLTWPLTSM